jgi:hypothetical protein
VGGALRTQVVSGRVVDVGRVARLLEGSAVGVPAPFPRGGGEGAEAQRVRRLVARCSRLGVGLPDALRAFEGQGGGCGVCGVVMTIGELRFDVSEGVLRGLVCRRCEAGLRYLGSPELLAGALGYVGNGANG